MSDGFGAKCTNIATMRSFGFPEGTIPDRFGVPFYFYREFMEYNDFFDEARNMIQDSDFISDREIREDMLSDFRKKINKADMPGWMLNALDDMHRSFPEGTSIRCRSSTNNEDLPGFSRAGLYDSKTQHPDEGHISKSIKQVYASLWNFKAFEERDFYRVDHFIASMGVLFHSNYSNEKVNGVAVSTDPVYQTENTYYINSQLGEDLITNPDSSSVPEEILLGILADPGDDYLVVRRSNLIPADSLLMGEDYLAQMRDFLTVIHDEFAVLYGAVNNDNFAMDIEFKITREDQLIIKQARPWAAFLPETDSLSIAPRVPFVLFPNPVEDFLHVKCADCEVFSVIITSLDGRQIVRSLQKINPGDWGDIDVRGLTEGVYMLSGFSENNNLVFSEKFVKQ